MRTSRLRYFVAPLFSLAGGDRVQRWPESSQPQQRTPFISLLNSA